MSLLISQYCMCCTPKHKQLYITLNILNKVKLINQAIQNKTKLKG